MSEHFWHRCSSCKTQIGFGVPYWTCSVSTCNRKGTGFVFCSVGCWEVHVPTLRHREAWAEEQRAPAAEAHSGSHLPSQTRQAAWVPAAASVASQRPPRRRIIVSPTSPPAVGSTANTAKGAPAHAEVPRDILIVASKLKAYVRARSGMNTSDGVLAELSDRVRELCDEAIARAREAGRKTIMDRDF